MKLSYCTRGWHDRGWADLAEMARDYDFSGLELYDATQPFFTGATGPFHSSALAATVRELNALELAIPCIDALCDLADPVTIEKNVRELEQCIRLAADLGTPYIRVRATQSGKASDESADEAVIACLKEAVPLAEHSGVTLLLESCGIYADTARLRDILNTFASDGLAALWDFQHPYRLFGESAETTIQNLGAYVKHVHVKDSTE